MSFGHYFPLQSAASSLEKVAVIADLSSDTVTHKTVTMFAYTAKIALQLCSKWKYDYIISDKLGP